MDSFRHPSMAKLFFNFFACLLAAFYLQKAIQSEISLYTRQKISIAILLTSLVTLVWGIAYIENSQLISQIIKGNISWQEAKSMFDKLSFFDLICLNTILQVPFLFIIFNSFAKKFNLKHLVIAGIANSIIMAMLFQPFTVVRKESRIAFQNVLNMYIKEVFPNPDLNSTIETNSVNNLDSVLKYGPLSLYEKRIAHSYNFLTPGRLKTQEEFWDNENLKKIIFQYPLLYRPDTALLFSNQMRYNDLFNKNFVVADDSTVIHFINSRQQKVPFTARILSFTPNDWNLEITSNEPGFYCLLQNNFPLWQLKIDGKEAAIKTCNLTFMGFMLDKGKHRVSFHYEAGKIKIAYYISTFLSIIILIWAASAYFKSDSKSNKT
jgi:hypothetical protein